MAGHYIYSLKQKKTEDKWRGEEGEEGDAGPLP